MRQEHADAVVEEGRPDHKLMDGGVLQYQMGR